MSLIYSGINWIVRSYIMLHIKGGTKFPFWSKSVSLIYNVGE